MMRVNVNATLIILILSATMPSMARAGDHYFSCVTPSGGYRLVLEDGTLRSGDKVIKNENEYKKLREVTVHEKDGVCVDKNNKKYDWNNQTYLLELLTEPDGQKTQLMFLCEADVDGTPAAVTATQCKTTFEKWLRPAFRSRGKRVVK